MTKLLLSFIASFGCVIGLATGATAHGGRSHPLTTPVFIEDFSSIASVQATIVPKATCAGTDGTYTLLHVTGSGPSTSTDPRMGGTFHVNAYILDSPTSGVGVSIDNWTITDPETGELKAKGKGLATDFGPHPRAVSYGRLSDGSTMVANAVVTLPPPGTNTLTIEYGGGGLVEADRGAILSGKNSCVRTLVGAIERPL